MSSPVDSSTLSHTATARRNSMATEFFQEFDQAIDASDIPSAIKILSSNKSLHPHFKRNDAFRNKMEVILGEETCSQTEFLKVYHIAFVLEKCELGTQYSRVSMAACAYKLAELTSKEKTSDGNSSAEIQRLTALQAEYQKCGDSWISAFVKHGPVYFSGSYFKFIADHIDLYQTMENAPLETLFQGVLAKMNVLAKAFDKDGQKGQMALKDSHKKA